MGEEQHHREKLATLNGDMPKQLRRAAVRVEQLMPLTQIPRDIKAVKAAGAAPTKAEFDAFVEDYVFVRKRLLEVTAMLSKFLNP